MIYGYARVSTKGQATDGNSLEAQSNALIENGAEVIYSDSYTGVKIHRPELDKLLNEIKEGDSLVVTKLDRIARSVVEGAQLIQRLMDMKVTINILNLGKIDETPTGKLICNIMLAFAEFERSLIIERTQEGKIIAKQNLNYKEGRPKKFTAAQIEHALSLLNNHSYSQVAEMTGISKATLVRAKAKKREE